MKLRSTAELNRSREKEDLRILNSGILSSTASTSFLAWRMIAALLGLSSIGTSSTRMVCRAKSANKRTVYASPLAFSRTRIAALA
ncbi:MAG: hypothetical protein P1U85_20670, partial [Verrucomicrobiales bacterium]|nr:hypothetical protein [Verrucomicrobiales bacterium]